MHGKVFLGNQETQKQFRRGTRPREETILVNAPTLDKNDTAENVE